MFNLWQCFPCRVSKCFKNFAMYIFNACTISAALIVHSLRCFNTAMTRNVIAAQCAWQLWMHCPLATCICSANDETARVVVFDMQALYGTLVLSIAVPVRKEREYHQVGRRHQLTPPSLDQPRPLRKLCFRRISLTTLITCTEIRTSSFLRIIT